jgi:hypothetical protein
MVHEVSDSTYFAVVRYLAFRRCLAFRLQLDAPYGYSQAQKSLFLSCIFRDGSNDGE